ncbi:MAG TPA: hypothetical protein VFD00_05945 [Thermoclostridium sp.]|nr:hypothetical protein [Thermoclostridium sp.]
MIRCNNCYKIFENESDLVKILISIENGNESGELYEGVPGEAFTQEIINGCPDCLTDAYLTDVEPTHMFCGYCLTKTRHFNNVCGKCGSNNTKIQGFNPNLM